MFRILMLTAFVTLSLALSKNEIEEIRKELNGELTKLEHDNIEKKSVDNNQVAKVKKNSIADLLKEMKTKKEVNTVENEKKEADSFFTDLIRDARKDEKRVSEQSQRLLELMQRNKQTSANNLDKMFHNILHQHAKKSTDNSLLDELLSLDVKQKKNADSANDELLKLIIEDEAANKKREMSSQKSKKEVEEELFKLLINNENKANAINSKRSMGDQDKKECEDARPDCKNFKDYCNVPGYKQMLAEECALTCGACKICRKDTTSNCKMAVERNMCRVEKYKAMMDEYCYESCGNCREKAPPACSFDPQGCCWDDSFARDGCPACMNNPETTVLCDRLRTECNNQGRPGEWMRSNCPITCKRCNPDPVVKQCHDYKNFGNQCQIWKENGQCDNEKVQEICKRTCKSC